MFLFIYKAVAIKHSFLNKERVMNSFAIKIFP